MAQQLHPNYNILFNHEEIERYRVRPTVTRPLSIRITELQNKLNITTPSVLPLGFYEQPPWLVRKPHINLECQISKKGEINNIKFRIIFHQILEKYPEYIKIYTDGSKTKKGVGSALAIRYETFSWSLPHAASIFTTELYAIWQALLYCSMNQENNYLICSDPLSALQSLENNFTTDPLVQRIIAFT